MTQLNQLSLRETEVAELLLQGKSNKQIAAVLNISVRAVEFHLTNIYTKLDVASRTEAVLKLANTLMRESTDGNLRETAVKDLNTNHYNGNKTIFQRIPLKKFLLVICGILLIIALIVTLTVLNSNTKKIENIPTLLSNNLTQTYPTSDDSTTLKFEERILTDTVGDVDPSFIDIISTRISQVEDGFLAFEFTVNGEIPLFPDPSNGNVNYKIWIDSNYDTKYPAHGGGNAEYVLNIIYDNKQKKWTGLIFDCALGEGLAAFEVTIDGITARAKVPLLLIGNPSSFGYSYESFTDKKGKDGDSNATIDKISFNYNGSTSSSEIAPKLTNTSLPIMPLPTATLSDCTEGWTQLKIGSFAIVAGTENDPPNLVRSNPIKNNNIISQLYPGIIVKVVDGPICADNFVFWKVENTSIPEGVGWTAEGDGNEYWLEPYIYTQELVRLSAYGVSFNLPGSWSNVPNAEVVPAGSNEYCNWPEHIKIKLTTYPVQSEWEPYIYVYETTQMPGWYPICGGAPLLRVQQQILSHGNRLLFGSMNAQPIFNSALIYGYIGKTTDEKYSIFAFFPVNFPFLAFAFQNLTLPQGGIPFNLDWDANDWSVYYQSVGKQMEESTDLDFTPNLNILDAIVESIDVTMP